MTVRRGRDCLPESCVGQGENGSDLAGTRDDLEHVNATPGTSRRRPPKLGPRRRARGRPSTRRPRWSLPITRAPVTSPGTGDVAASGGADAASLPVPPLPRGREVDVTDRISRRHFAREVDAAQPQLSPPRAIEGLSNNLRGPTLAFSRGRRILHAEAGKIR